MHQRVSELFEALEAKKGNTASQLAYLDTWLDGHWSFSAQEFGETFKFFKSNTSTVVACADKFGQRLGQVWCEAIKNAVQWVGDNPSAALAAVEKLAPACRDKGNCRIVLNALAGPPVFAQSTSIKAASGYFGEELDIDICRKIVKDYGDSVKAKQQAAQQEEMDKEVEAEQQAQQDAWFKMVEENRAYPIYIKFWKTWVKRKNEGPPLTNKDTLFSYAEHDIKFCKMSGSGTIPKAMIPSFMPDFIKKQGECKVEERQAIIKKGQLFYFKNTTAKGCIPLHNCHDLGEIKKKAEHYLFEVHTKLPRRIGSQLGCCWEIGGKTEEEATKLRNIVMSESKLLNRQNPQGTKVEAKVGGENPFGGGDV